MRANAGQGVLRLVEGQMSARLLRKRRRATGTVGALLLAVVLAVGAAPASAQAACPNEAIRVEQSSTALPACRAYELVSPGSLPRLTGNGYPSSGIQAALNGEALAYRSYYPAETDPKNGFFFLSLRGEDGWSVSQDTPQTAPGGSAYLFCEPQLYYSANLTASVLGEGWNIEEQEPGGAPCSQPEEVIAPNAPAGYGNLYLQNEPGAPHQLVNLTPEGATPANAQFLAASNDFSHILFGENAQLTAEAPAGYNLYEWAAGRVHLVTVLPNGTPVVGVIAGLSATEEFDHPNHSSESNAVSANGEDVSFYAGGKLYLRENATAAPAATTKCGEAEAGLACTVEIDASRGRGESGGGVFQFASTNGNRVFFTDERMLTVNSTAKPERPELYEYNVAEEKLTDLTVDTGEAAHVLGFSGGSEGGSYIYFVAEGALTAGQENSSGAVAQPKQPNLYLDHNGQLTFIATLSATGDGLDWQVDEGKELNTGILTTRTAPSGKFFAFTSSEKLTGFENTPEEAKACQHGIARSIEACQEIFLYEAASTEYPNGRLRCASCSPTGALPTANTALPGQQPLSGGASERIPQYGTRNLTAQGTLFFTTADSLLPQDGNGVDDVYEYSDGNLSLISTGTASTQSTFFDASEGGADVFFATAQSLIAGDTNNALSIYDARVDGGFPNSGATTGKEPACVSLEACRPPLGEPPVQALGASATFNGAGDLAYTEPKIEESEISTQKGKGKGKGSKGSHHHNTASVRARKLKHALRMCAKKPKRRRRECRARAHRRFGAAHRRRRGRHGEHKRPKAHAKSHRGHGRKRGAGR